MSDTETTGEATLREALADLSRMLLCYGPERGMQFLLEATLEEKLVRSFKKLELERLRKEELGNLSPRTNQVARVRVYRTPQVEHEYAIPPYVGPLRAMLWNFCSLVELVESAKSAAAADGSQFPLPADDTLLYGERVAGYVTRNLQYSTLCKGSAYPDTLWTAGLGDVPVESSAFMAEITRVRNLLCARSPAAHVPGIVRAFDGMTNKTHLTIEEIPRALGSACYGLMYAKHHDGVCRAYLVAKLDYPDAVDRCDMLFVSNIESHSDKIPGAPLSALVVLTPPPSLCDDVGAPMRCIPNPVAGPVVSMCFAM